MVLLVDEISSDGKMRINKPVLVKHPYNGKLVLVYENDMPDGTVIRSPEPLIGEEYNEHFDKHL